MYKTRMKVMVNGREMELYTVGYASKLIGKSVETLRFWERTGVIPKPMFKYT